MSDPRRWLNSIDATALERELLERELAMAPRPDLERQVWDAVVSCIPPIDGGGLGGGESAAGGGLGHAVGAGSASALAVAKSLAIGALAGTVVATGAVGVGSRLSPRAAEPARATASARAEPNSGAKPTQTAQSASPAEPASAPPVRAFEPVPADSELASLPSATGTAKFELPASSDLASRVRAERDLLQRARQRLQNADPNGALMLLEEARKSFGGGMLAQEREVLAIEALGAAGKLDQARSRAKAFLDSFPGSPHAGHVRRFAQ